MHKRNSLKLINESLSSQNDDAENLFNVFFHSFIFRPIQLFLSFFLVWSFSEWNFAWDRNFYTALENVSFQKSFFRFNGLRTRRTEY